METQVCPCKEVKLLHLEVAEIICLATPVVATLEVETISLETLEEAEAALVVEITSLE